MENELTFDIAADELKIFLEDVNECLQAMETGILHLEKKHDSKTLNAIFRAAHTLKAIAGIVGHRQMAELTHTLETIFDTMRQTEITPTQTMADKLLTTLDVLKALRDEIVKRQPSGVDVAAHISRLRTLVDNEDTQKPIPTVPSFTRQVTPEQATQIETLSEAGKSILEVEVVAAAEAFAPAARLYQAAVALMEAGQFVAQQPALDDLTEGDARLWLILATQSEIKDIENILEDIDDIAKFQVKFYLADEKEASENNSTVEADVDSTPDQSVASTATAPQLNPTPNLDKAETVRISVERLDTLMNLVGELVTNRAHLLQIEEMLQKGEGVGALSEMVGQYSHVVDRLQEEVMRARMLPIASLFNKFPRLVRDAARLRNKQVDLVIEGEATELDRAVIEAIGDPLVHLLRNAVDHGLETPQVRQATNKAPTGVIHLSAEPVEGQIVVTITDDGQGIDPDKIRKAAVSHNLITEEEIAQLTEEEIIELIFQPNLSTVTQVTEMSGRGVGLDVVRTNVERLSGSVVVTSKVGHGTTFQLTLPLTLALVRAMLVTVQNTLYALPVSSINGAMYLAEASLNTIKGKPAIDWQDAIIPLLDLREFFSHPRLVGQPVKEAKPSVALVSWGKHRIGLVVDKIIGQQEIVVKLLSPLIGHTPGLSGATVLGDGQIALIIDIPGLINTALQIRRQGEM